MNNTFNYEEFKIFIKVVSENEDYENIIRFLFEKYISDINNISIINLVDNMSETFESRSDAYIEYFTSIGYVKDDTLNEVENKVVIFTNKLKKIYGNMIRKAELRERSPLSINTLSVDAGKAVSHVTVNMVRNDQEKLSGICTLSELLQISNTMNLAIASMLESGVYNISERIVLNTVFTNEIVVSKLKSMRVESDN